MGKIVEFKVVGMTFVPGNAYPANLYRLNELADERKADAIRKLEPDGPGQLLPITLFRDPANPYDANAIEVHAPVLGRVCRIGFVPKVLAAKLAPTIDRGDEWDARLVNVLIAEGHEDNPGAEVRLERITNAADPTK